MISDIDGRADTAWFAERFERLAANVESFIRGKSDVVRMALVCMMAEGHLLIDDVPGVGKTSLAKAIAQSIKGSMRRIQFTPDLLPSDVTGVLLFDAGRREFVFHEGAVFANIVLGDEINRASPKTQSALLEVMAERQVTVDSQPYAVPRPFIVIATQNPVEHGGTYDLPEAQLDRFMMRTKIGYPDHDAEVEVIVNGARGRTSDEVGPVMDTEELARMTRMVTGVHIAPAIASYIVTISDATRRMDDVLLGVSPRGSLALAQASQAHAISRGRGFITPDDVKIMAPYVLSHRTILRPEATLRRLTPEKVIAEVLQSVYVPTQRTG
ncbi:MoxR family ATPase [Dactylosporangium sp. NPDC049525]|uniref:AAA family ATPase n=1 Tax=Dactylosporangium sp. NPDC049525 TaxID=3154730 RepID=UPI00344A6097